ncbi:MAG: hypothetical protein ACI8ZN_002551 [Bacteroidia bacterium]|jgi:hypothetical protein
MTRKSLFSILLSITFSQLAHSQEIKTNFIAPFSVSYEHFLKDLKAVELGVQMRPPMLGNSATITRGFVSYRMYKGRKINILNSLLHQHRGRYASIYARYTHLSDVIRTESFELNSLALGGTLGVKRYFKKVFPVEFFVGGGFRPYVSSSNKSLVSPGANRFEINAGFTFGITWEKGGLVRKPVLKDRLKLPPKKTD